MKMTIQMFKQLPLGAGAQRIRLPNRHTLHPQQRLQGPALHFLQLVCWAGPRSQHLLQDQPPTGLQHGHMQHQYQQQQRQQQVHQL